MQNSTLFVIASLPCTLLLALVGSLLLLPLGLQALWLQKQYQSTYGQPPVRQRSHQRAQDQDENRRNSPRNTSPPTIQRLRIQILIKLFGTLATRSRRSKKLDPCLFKSSSKFLASLLDLDVNIRFVNSLKLFQLGRIDDLF